MSEIDQEFVEYVVKSIVDNPDKVNINRSVDERGVLLELTVDPDDMGKVIGRAGATAKAIRTLLRVLGAKSDARFNLKVIEPGGGEVASGGNDDTQPAEAPVDETPKAEGIAEKTKKDLADLDDLDI